MKEFLLGSYLWIKSIHLIFVVAWMAAMLYLPRLFVYLHQTEVNSETWVTLNTMARRLTKGIMNPSLIIVWVLGLMMIWLMPSLLSGGWLHSKILLVLIMSGLHGFYVANLKKFGRGEKPRSEKFWRIINEVPFVLMIIVIILVIVKPF